MTREKKEDLKFEIRMREAWTRGFIEGTVARIDIKRRKEKKKGMAKARLPVDEIEKLQPA